jgi:chromosome segregation ATPase
MAADVSARVHLVAEKLQQKAQDAQRKGNENAARALSASVSDLRQALALISEQRHLLMRRRGECDDEDDEAHAPVQELAARLARVEAMLGKKASDMKLKGNENAAAALQQSAGTVEKGRQVLIEQQQSIFGLLGRWEKLGDVVNGTRRRSSVATSDGEEDMNEDTPHGRLIARVKDLVQLGAVIRSVFPEVKEAGELREELATVEELRSELQTARDEADEAREMLKQESLALEEAKKEMEVQRQKEAMRQEEDAALLEQQREACQAMEQLVRESDQEIQRMTLGAKASAEEMQSLRVEMESLATEKEHLVGAHADEVEELQAQLASAMDAISTKGDEGAEPGAEELQTLQAKMDALMVEKEQLVKAHADEIDELTRQLEAASDAEELQSLRSTIDTLTSESEKLVKLCAAEAEELERTHSLEMDKLRQQLENAAVSVDELQALQAKMNSLISEKDELEKAHSDEVEELQKVHADEVERLQCQLESASASLSAASEKDGEELQSLKVEIASLISEKEELAGAHANELERLRHVHSSEIEAIRRQLGSPSVDLLPKTKERAESDADELQQLRAEVGALTIEKDHLVKEHADEIEKLSHQVESAKAAAQDVSAPNDAGADEDEESDLEDTSDVPVLELEEEESQPEAFSAADEVEASSNGADGMPSDAIEASKLQTTIAELQSQLAEHTVRSQTQQEFISSLEHEHAELQEKVEALTRDKAQAVDELQRAHEAEALRLGTNLEDLQAKITEYEERYQAQQSTIASLEKEQAEIQERVEVLTNEKAQELDKLHSTHGEETTRLTQRLAEREGTIESLSAEQNDAAQALERCAAELDSCRSELDARTQECTQVKRDLEAVRDAEVWKTGDSQRFEQLSSELQQVTARLASSDAMDAAVARSFLETEWQRPELTALCDGLVSLLDDLVSARDQLQSTETTLEAVRSEGANQKLLVVQFMRTSDWRLFAKEGEEEEEVSEALASDVDLCEHLEVAKANIGRWLAELEQLRGHVDKDAVKLSELEQEKLQDREQLATIEASKRDLETTIESLNEKLVGLQAEKEEMAKAADKLQAQTQTATIQEKQQQAAQLEEVAELQQQLASVRSEFERYRLRSHTALKKMEKRAELLNGMRKENEALLKQVTESEEQRDQAEAARNDSEARLQEVQRTQEMMQADFDQFAAEKARVIAELEQEGARLVSERQATDARIQELSLKIQELETEKTQVEEESERIKDAEQAAFQARLSTATAAAQTAKQDLQKVHDALEASKAENDKQQKLVESLERKLEQQANAPSTTGSSIAITTTTAAYVPAHASPSAEVKANVAGLEKELASLRASEAALRRQLDAARAELVALQERFATTKAANAEKVFALEEQSNHWKAELDATAEEVRRLTALLDAQKTNGLNGNAVPTVRTPGAVDSQREGELTASAARIEELSREIHALKAELADASTEISLLTRALDASREESKAAQDQLDVLTPSSEPESGEDSRGVSKVSSLLVVKDEALKKLRVQVLELQDELQTLRDEKAALELELEKDELDELQASRKHTQTEKERAMQLQRRQTLVSSFEKQVAAIVDELQKRLEEHSSAFREVCEFRDAHSAKLYDGGAHVNAGHGSEEFEECLVMRSGAVIKAGASFELPVICEKRGWRVVWSFSVKEDAADVSFKLSAKMADATSTEMEVVSPERMNEMSGVFQVQKDDTTLVFEWDNSFSWLNEKTLDYHVSIQEPLTPQAQEVRRSERDLQAKAKLLEDGQALIQAEGQRRAELSATLERLSDCEAAKNQHLEEFGARKAEVLAQKARFQEEMDAQKAAFSAMLEEQDELEDVERSIARVWEGAVAEREDVEMTLQLAGNGAQLETLAHEIQEQAEAVAEQLRNPIQEEDREAAKEEIGSKRSGVEAQEVDAGNAATTQQQGDVESPVEEAEDKEQYSGVVE